ncbi:MAG: hypothetical protein GY838_16525 [bacterium]|nr:hypothetical protein [bacterium]
MPRIYRFLLFLSVVLLHGVTHAWEVPEHWAELGTVGEWRHRDDQIYRSQGNAPFVNRSQDRVDLRKVYAETWTYLGSLDEISLADFLALDEAGQQQRIDAARRHRTYVLRFRDRMDEFVNQVRSNLDPTWGLDVADVTAVGECLKHLRAAVAMDPANAHAWHLYAMFAGIAGDTDRALDALAGAEAALDQVPAGELTGMRAAVALNRAWTLRNQGAMTRALAALDEAAAHGASGREAVLLRGLLAAQTGDIQTAVEQASRLRDTEIKVFPSRLQDPGLWGPARTNMGAWRTVDSDYLQTWIMAQVWLAEGEVDMARKALHRYAEKNFYPFAWRFWNDAGRIYEVTGRPELAREAWTNARVWAPYAPFFPVKSYGTDVSRLTGRPGVHAVHMAYDRFYRGGHRLVRGALLAHGVSRAKDEMKRLELAGRAMDELATCRDAGTYPAQASLLLGAVYNHMGDVQSAVLEVERALDIIETEGDTPGHAALLEELAQVRANRSATGVEAFYSQSGTARSRWDPVIDPEAERAALQAAYEAEAVDANRRALARYLVRHDEAETGRDLVGEHAAEHAEDMAILLEAERNLGETAQAQALVAGLRAGDDPFADAEVWTLAGFICLDAGLAAEARVALERALELDPGNHALRTQMRLLG